MIVMLHVTLLLKEQCKEEFAQVAKEREQQASLALEDVELQKTALRTEADNRIKEIQLELEAARTVSGISKTTDYCFFMSASFTVLTN